MKQCKTLLKSVLNAHFPDAFPTTFYETALQIMLISAKTENRQGGKKTPKDIRYNMYTSLLLAILTMDKMSVLGNCREKSGILRFVEHLSGVSMREHSLCNRIHFKFNNEVALRKNLEYKMNICGSRRYLRKNNKITLNNRFDINQAYKNYERRMRDVNPIPPK